MRGLKSTVVAIAALALAMGLSSVTPAEAPYSGPVVCQEFDREECLRECRWSYLGTPYGLHPEEHWRGGPGSGPWLYFACVQKCEERAWKDFERHFEDE